MKPLLHLEPVVPSDLESLFALRMEAMRESLTRLGLTDMEHSRSRYAGQCEAGAMHHIVRDGQRVGFVQLVPAEGYLHLVQLFLSPQAQGGGVGARVLDWAKSHGREIRLSTLKFSASNRFYLRRGFEPVGESELDIQYRWIAPGTALV